MGWNEFFQYLRRRLDKISFHTYSTDPRPLHLPAEYMVHQMAKLVKKRLHISVLHQAGIRCSRLRKVAHQGRLWKLLASDAIQQRYRLGVAELAGPWMHVEVEPANQRSPSEISQVSTLGSHAGTFASWRKLTWKNLEAVSMMSRFTRA